MLLSILGKVVPQVVEGVVHWLHIGESIFTDGRRAPLMAVHSLCWRIGNITTEYVTCQWTHDLNVGLDSCMQDWPSALSVMTWTPVPASPPCLLCNFDLCYLSLIVWGASVAVTEGDGVNIRDWHFCHLTSQAVHFSVAGAVTSFIALHYSLQTLREDSGLLLKWLYFFPMWLIIDQFINHLVYKMSENSKIATNPQI